LNRGYTPRAFSHPNGQLSLLGAAAAGARLHGLDGAGISLAVRVATTMLIRDCIGCLRARLTESYVR